MSPPENWNGRLFYRKVGYLSRLNLSANQGFGFHLSRVSGSHHIFAHPHVRELVNLQNVNGKAKPYQIRQLLQLVERYDLRLREEP